MRGSRNFCQGGWGPGPSDKKSSDSFYFFLVLSLFYRSQMVNFKEQRKLSFFKVPEGVQHFPGGSSFFQGGGGGSNCLFPIETHITCDFPGGVRTPCPPLWICTCLGLSCFFFAGKWLKFAASKMKILKD